MSARHLRPWLPWAAAVVLFAFGGSARAGEAYYLLLFGAQRVPNAPSCSHTFATFVRAVWRDGGPPCLEAYTVSWLPRNLRVRPFALEPEEGVNLDLEQTLRWAGGCEARVSLWGPFQIRRELYCKAVARIRVLEAGAIRYKALDLGYPPDCASNCIHAVSSVVDGERLHIGPLAWGETASYRLLPQFCPWIIQPDTVHPWVAGALGLDAYPIIYRQGDEDPRSGLFRGPLSRLLGREPQAEARYGPPP